MNPDLLRKAAAHSRFEAQKAIEDAIGNSDAMTSELLTLAAQKIRDAVTFEAAANTIDLFG